MSVTKMTIPQLTGTENETLRKFAQIEPDFGRVLLPQPGEAAADPYTRHTGGGLDIRGDKLRKRGVDYC